jgi:hypothetical protein
MIQVHIGMPDGFGIALSDNADWSDGAAINCALSINEQVKTLSQSSDIFITNHQPTPFTICCKLYNHFPGGRVQKVIQLVPATFSIKPATLSRATSSPVTLQPESLDQHQAQLACTSAAQRGGFSIPQDFKNNLTNGREKGENITQWYGAHYFLTSRIVPTDIPSHFNLLLSLSYNNSVLARLTEDFTTIVGTTTAIAIVGITTGTL